MNTFQEVFRKVYSSPHYNKVIRSVKPLYEHFGVNHFWFHKITNSGQYFHIGPHADWNDYVINNIQVGNFPWMRHPDLLDAKTKILSMDVDPQFVEIRKVAWEKYSINHNIMVQERVHDGVVAFGFGTRFNNPMVNEKLLNDLPLLLSFTEYFREENKKIFNFVYENPIDLAFYAGDKFFNRKSDPIIPLNRQKFIREIGLGVLFEMSPRQIDVLKYLASGYPSSYIAKELLLSKRTVENYISDIKMKLDCTCKVELINKAKEMIRVIDL